ncbi:MAG: biotin--[acetyl-CoA-carboxylase] ligase [Spirochaetaceae bacterium]|nr:biotin--[acetyl-CoA-carboxylase] ligase [Spirochaetaceae bacterium]
MKTLIIHNPFGGPIFHFSRITSTMDKARQLVQCGQANGTVIVADEQSAGRGRRAGRKWLSPTASNLLFTVIVQVPVIPAALSLRVGLALAQAIEDFVPALSGTVRIKWPNDCLIDKKKVAGILIESDGSTVFIGMGVNYSQQEFDPVLQEKATSIACACGMDMPPQARFVLLEAILHRFFDEMFASGTEWLKQVEKRLYRKGERVCFHAGGTELFTTVEGKIQGIGSGGELLIECDSGELQAFITGEIVPVVQ